MQSREKETPAVSNVVEPQCTAPFPHFTFKHALFKEDARIQKAAHDLDNALTARFNEGGLDSVAVAVVTAEGSVYEGFWGARRANETDESKKGTVDRNTVYRLASISKIFTTMETYLLRDRGILNLDDEVTKFFPELKFTENEDPVTLRQLASHMSGLGRDWPPGPAEGLGPGVVQWIAFPLNEEFLKGIAEVPLVAPTYTFPIYSNTGFSLLGLANVAANRAAEGPKAPSTHADLVKRDIFEPLSLTGSSFVASEANKQNIAVSSVASVETDLDFKDATNPAGGQMSSLSDLVKVMQTIIDPKRPESLLRPSTIREWMKPLYSFWDDYQEVGLMWEIFRVKDAFGRFSRRFVKFGELIGHHTVFSINPGSAFGVIILTTSQGMQTIPLNELVFSHFQPAFDSIAEEKTSELLGGCWLSSDQSVRIIITVEKGSLFATDYVINGADVLQNIQPDGISRRTPLISTGGHDLRLAYAYGNGYATNVLRVKQSDERVTLLVPAIGAELQKSPGAMMVSSRRLFAVKLSVVFLGLLNVYLSFTLRNSTVATVASREYSYINNDFPATLNVLGLNDKVLLLPEHSVHYALNGTEADEEWLALLPPSGGMGIVHLGPHYRMFAVTMLHTLHCLDLMRKSIFAKPTGSGNIRHIEHCVNYVRELVLCSADTQLEPVGDPRVVRVCRDWTAIYAEMQRNLVEYEAKAKEIGNTFSSS